MNRRELLLRSLIATLGLTGAQILVSCGKDTSGPGNSDGSLTATSSSSGHTHQFTLTAAELASPVAISRNDSTSGGHAHLVELTANQVTLIARGSAVQLSSGVTNGHSHTYTFQKS